ncbi:hypothetical protein [Legionella fallonii]|uniref:Uncharacterized protein n=1 Tax=Legionella fallonii LLAP-10 TaxID=1212491 RepID=A0A098G495_9GAMM|nr:hypothetical protein [Legionella fallonii]CEG57313.1 protein of unknown function [Legionella fallonii LLAP-10]
MGKRLALNVALDSFEEMCLRGVRDKIKSLNQEFQDTHDSKERTRLSGIIKEFRQFETYLIADIRGLMEQKTYPTNEEVIDVFVKCIKDAEGLKDYIRDNRSFGELIIDTLKNIANFFIKLLTIGNTPCFFDTTTTTVARVQEAAAVIATKLDEAVALIDTILNEEEGERVHIQANA